jgi:hypothetical protein
MWCSVILGRLLETREDGWQRLGQRRRIPG